MAKNLYFVNNRKSAHPVMKAINVATRFFALNRPADVAAALKAVDVVDGTLEMIDLALLLLLVTCLKPGDVETRTWCGLMELCDGKLAGEKAAAADTKKRNVLHYLQIHLNSISASECSL